MAERMPHNNPRTITACTPGGIARQIRVQYHRADESEWHLFSTFTRRETAQTCADDLRSRGLIVRLIQHRRVPVAA